MSDDSQKLPEEGDFVLITITKVHPHCAFAKLDEYGVEGMIHVSELTNSWVRNIRNHVKEGKHGVAKVIGVDAKKGHVNLSLKRVSDKDKKDKSDQIRRTKRGARLMSLLSDALKLTPAKAKKLEADLAAAYGEVYFAFEEAKKDGIEDLSEIISKKDAKALGEIAEKNVTIPVVQVSGILSVSSNEPNGVEIVKEVLSKSIDENFKVSYLGAPRFKIKLTGTDYKLAEQALQTMAEKATEVMAGRGVVKFVKE